MLTQEKVLNTVKKHKMILQKDKILCAVSGGADSVCLLLLLQELRKGGLLDFDLRALHVHHGLRKTADRDAAFVVALCREQQIPLTVRRVDVSEIAGTRGMSIEEAGREARYAILREEGCVWGEGVKAAIAHHQEDSVETTLFNLCRGSSLLGLTGIRPVTERDKMTIIRPLIALTRPEIEAWLAQREQPFCEDETNEDIIYTRNFIRRRILPQLEAHVNQESVMHIAAASEDIQGAEEYLSEQTQKERECCRIKEDSGNGRWVYKVSLLEKLAPYIQSRVIYDAICEAAGARRDITRGQINEIIGLLQTTGSAEIVLVNGLRVRKEYDQLIFYRETAGDIRAKKEYPEDPDEYVLRCFSYKGKEADIPDGPYTKWLDYDKIQTPVLCRTRLEGDGMMLEAGGPDKGVFVRKKLARIMIDLKIPVSVRERVVFPMDGSEVLWIPGYRISASHKVGPETKTILEISIPDGR